MCELHYNRLYPIIMAWHMYAAECSSLSPLRVTYREVRMVLMVKVAVHFCGGSLYGYCGIQSVHLHPFV